MCLKKKPWVVIRHGLETRLLQSICAGCALALTSLQCAERGCKPQSVKSRGPRRAPVSFSLLLHKLSVLYLLDFFFCVFLTPVSHSKHSKCVFLAGAEDIKKKKKTELYCEVVGPAVQKVFVVLMSLNIGLEGVLLRPLV